MDCGLWTFHLQGPLPIAVASSVHEMERMLFFVLLQIIVILLSARIGGQIARKVGQPRVVGEIIVGLLLGPSLFGRLHPSLFDFLFQSTSGSSMNILSQIGLILLMFQIGLEFDFSHLKEAHNRKAVLLISAAGILLPFSLGFILGKVSAPYLAPNIHPFGYTLFMATALSITAIPILGRIMIEFNLTRTRMGAVAITAAAINDVIGWILLALISALTVAEFSSAKFSKTLLLLGVYFAVCWWLAKPILHRIVETFRVSPQKLPQNLLAIILAMIFISGLFTYKLGIFAIFGGFMMGILLYDQSQFVAAWKNKISDFITVFFLPIFFTYTGLRTNVHGLDSLELWSWCAAVIAVATFGKFVGCFFAARWAGMSRAESSCIGIMMNTRALMELIILNVGYDLGVIPQNVFTMLVLMAIFSTVITSPFLRFWLPKMGHVIRPRDA